MYGTDFLQARHVTTCMFRRVRTSLDLKPKATVTAPTFVLSTSKKIRLQQFKLKRFGQRNVSIQNPASKT